MDLIEAHSQTTKKDSQIAEVTIGFKGGAVLHASERTDDMYASIDIVSHKLAQSLKVRDNCLIREIFINNKFFIRYSTLTFTLLRNTTKRFAAKDLKKNPSC